MKNTTLVYILKDGCALMLHRVKKEHDINHGKWIGVGGKFEWGESPEECMRREVREETGLLIDKYRYCGIVTFVSDTDDMEYMHLFTVTQFHDEYGNSAADGTDNSDKKVVLKKCDEGVLEWIPLKQLTHIPHWAGDRLFFSMIFGTKFPFFSMKFVYDHGNLAHASVNEHNCLVTDRLILRPWLEQDASALYKAVSNPKIGPAAGWAPHTDVAMSRKVIRDVLTRPETYAIVLRDTSDPIGSIALQNFRIARSDGSLISYFDERKSEDPLCCTRSCIAAPGGVQTEASLGYWIAEPYWHQGLISEAAEAVLEHGRRDLGLKRVWADHFEGNDASRRVMEKAGFRYHHIETQRYQHPGEEERARVFNVLEF